MKERLTKERLEQLKQRYRDFGSLHWMDAQEIVIELEQVQSELTEKDATIKELQEALDNPKSHLLFKLHNEQALKEQAMRARDTALNSHYTIEQENVVLRKALEEARSTFGIIATHSTDEKAVKAASDGFNLVEAALGEGDKE